MSNMIFNDVPFFPSAAIIDSPISIKGTIGDAQSGADINSLPTYGYVSGDAYRVVTAGTYAGVSCEPGDLIVAVHDGPVTGSTVINSDWTVIQANVDGAVTTDDDALTDGNVIVGNGIRGVKDSGVAVDTLPTNLTNGEGNYSVQQVVDAEGGQVLALGKWSFAEGRGNNFEVSYGSKDYANSQLTVATKSGNPQAYQVRKNAILWIQSPDSMGGAWYYATADNHSSSHRDYTTLTLDAQTRTIYDGDGTSASHIVRYHSWEDIDSTWTIKVYMGAAAASDSHIEGNFNNTVWLNSDTELNEANVNRSHAEGSRTIAAGFCAHSEGENTQAIGAHSHTEGLNTYAGADCAHTEGSGTQASAANSHAEGENTQANAINSHAQGGGTKAGGNNSFAGGYRSEVAIDHSMVHGFYVTANAGAGTQTAPIGKAVFGQYNTDDNNALFEIGNGSDNTHRKNAFEVRKDGSLGVNSNSFYMKTLSTIDAIRDAVEAGFYKISLPENTYVVDNIRYGEMITIPYIGTSAPYSAQILFANGDNNTNKNKMYYRTCAGLSSGDPSWNDWIKISNDYNNLINTPTVPTKTSDLQNDSGFLTTTNFSDFSAQDIADLWDEVDV